LRLGNLGVGLFTFKTQIFSGDKESKSTIERDLYAIDQAREAKDLIEQNSKNTIAEGEILEKTDQKVADQNNNKKIMQAVIHTSKGDITIEFSETTPKTVENFIRLAKEGFYDGTKFHRVIKGFMNQGGDPLSKDDTKSDYWGTGGPGYKFADEIVVGNKNDKYTISMANAGPNTNGSQFFINVNNNAFLDGKHTVFGKVTAGMDVVTAIENVATVPGDRPVDAVIITKATVTTK
jgi:peptidylprolyl isomerase